MTNYDILLINKYESIKNEDKKYTEEFVFVPFSGESFVRFKFYGFIDVFTGCFWEVTLNEVAKTFKTPSPNLVYRFYRLKKDKDNWIAIDCHVGIDRFFFGTKPGKYHVMYFINGKESSTPLPLNPLKTNAIDFLTFVKNLLGTRKDPFV